MLISRRGILGVVGGLAVVGPARAQPGAPAAANAGGADPRLGERSFGHPDAPVAVQEFFSMTCTHCAAFSREVMPEITAKLIDTGKLRFVYGDFPLDQVALTAAMVARALPPERYEPFLSALFASQDRWAFTRTGNSTEELAKMAMLAGMSRATFDATIADNTLKNAILAEQKAIETKYKVDATPTFVVGDRTHSGEMSFSEFVTFAGVTV